MHLYYPPGNRYILPQVKYISEVFKCELLKKAQIGLQKEDRIQDALCITVIHTVTVMLHQVTDWLQWSVWASVVSLSLRGRFIVINGVSCHASLASRPELWGRWFRWQTFMFYWSRQNTIKSPWPDTASQPLPHNTQRMGSFDSLIWSVNTQQKWECGLSIVPVIRQTLLVWGIIRKTVN